MDWELLMTLEHVRRERMILQMPGAWGTMSGEEMDDDGRSRANGMTGLQHQHQQQAKAVESSQPGSNSSSGWGSCSELLLVSAVKKHGVPNWNLVASELKARAILLNTPPSCFSEEACKFKYNALKGKFASRSCGGGVSSPDDDLDGVTWFEELRKLRMSHLKEELHVYDSSIGQLQSRINKLKEERSQYFSLQSVMKQYDSSCRLDTIPNGCKVSDSTSPVSTRRSEERFEKPQDLILKYPSKADPSVGMEILHSAGMALAMLPGWKKSPVTSTPKLTFRQDTTEEVDSMADGTAEPRVLLESDRSGEKAAEKGGQQVGKNGANDALQVKEGQIGGKGLDQERRVSNSDQATWELLENSCGGELEVNLLEDTASPRVKGGFFNPENGESMYVQDRAQGNDAETDILGDTLCSLAGSTSTNLAIAFAEDFPHRDSPEAVVLQLKPLEVDTSNNKAVKGESISRRESRLSRLSFGRGRADRDKKLKAKEEPKLKPMSWPEARQVDHQLSQETAEVDVSDVDVKDTKDSSLLFEHRENGRLSPCDPEPSDEVDTGFGKQVVSDSSTAGLGDGTGKGPEESVRLSSEERPVDTDFPRNDVEMHLESSGLVPSTGAEPRLVRVDLPTLPGTLTVALGSDPDLLDPQHSVVVLPNLEFDPVAPSERELSVASSLQHKGAVETETATKVNPGSCENRRIGIKYDRKSDEGPHVADEIRVESDIVEVGQDEDGKIEMVGFVTERVKRETLDTDLGTSMSLNDDVPETSNMKESENAKDESRDGPGGGEARTPFPDCTDSQIDKSEVGSSMDSIEDMSPSSRKHRREPKISGKFLPLLECLRVICAHRFAPLFRQRQEYQDKAEYGRLIKRHVDLSMVRARLEDGAYSGSVEFFRDLLLIFTNALVYNTGESQEYVGARALRSCALSEMDKILQTEALLKQNGPATRTREVRKSVEFHRMRVSLSSTGSESRKKGISKGSNDTATAFDLQGVAKISHIAFEDPHTGRSSNNSEDDRDLDERLETFKTLTPNRIVREETSRKDDQKPEFLWHGGIGAGGNLGKKVRVDSRAAKTTLHGLVVDDLRGSGKSVSVETVGTKTMLTPAEMKDVRCKDVAIKGPLNISSSLLPLGLPLGKKQTLPILRQTSASRVSRYSKRGGDSVTSIPKKRIRK